HAHTDLAVSNKVRRAALACCEGCDDALAAVPDFELCSSPHRVRIPGHNHLSLALVDGKTGVWRRKIGEADQRNSQYGNCQRHDPRRRPGSPAWFRRSGGRPGWRGLWEAEFLITPNGPKRIVLLLHKESRAIARGNQSHLRLPPFEQLEVAFG